MKAIIRVDGNARIGMGHIMRCLSLAKAMKSLGFDITFLCCDSCSIIEQEGFRVISTELGEGFYVNMCDDSSRMTLLPELPQVISILENEKPYILIVDNYYATDEYLIPLGEHLPRLGVIDDFGDKDYPVDILINYHVYAINELKIVEQNRWILNGPSYCLLRDEFLKIPKRIIQPQVKRVMITMGGADPQYLTGQLINELINRLSSEIEIHVVVGPLFTHKDSLVRTYKDVNRIIFHDNPNSMAAMMFGCDLAISAGGSTLYELCATGTPSVSIIIVDNQRRLANALGRLGATLCVGELSSIGVQRVGDAVIELIQNESFRSRMSQKGQTLVDGRGAERVAKSLFDICSQWDERGI